MGNTKRLITTALLVSALSGEFSFAGLNSTDPDPGNTGMPLGGSLGVSSGITIPTVTRPPTAKEIQTSTECSSSISDTYSEAERCWGITPAPAASTDTPEAKDNKDSKENKDSKKDGGKGTAGKNNDAEAAEEAARLAAKCRAQYQSALQSCDTAIGSAGNSCNADRDVELKAAATSIGQVQQNSTSAVQASCSEAGDVSNSAQGALTSFRNKCSSSISSCTNSCGTLTSFLQSNSACYPSLNLTADSAQSLAQTKTSTCQSYQSHVAQADQSISSYKAAASASAACQVATAGGQSENTMTAYNSTFCQAHPANPGCANSASVNCDDPSQANNKVCVCSKNPNHPMCVNTQSLGAEADLARSRPDPSSRLPASNAEVNGGGNEKPDLSALAGAARPERTADAEGIDGRQGGAAVGNSTVSAGEPEKLASIGVDSEKDLDVLMGAVHRGGGKIPYKSRSSLSGKGPMATIDPAQDPHSPRAPDLRQFLPGGVSDPRGYSGITGSIKIGIDGITGPHSDLWKKIQNRYQILQGTFEP